MIWRRPGPAAWGRETIEVALDAYRYAEQPQAMEGAYRRFDETQIDWRDGRLIRVGVGREPQVQLRKC